VAGRGSSTVTGGHQRNQVRANLRGARHLGAPLTPIFTPTHPNITRLRPTRLHEDCLEIRVPRALFDINRHPNTH
jgi:hypothetical protein